VSSAGPARSYLPFNASCFPRCRNCNIELSSPPVAFYLPGCDGRGEESPPSAAATGANCHARMKANSAIATHSYCYQTAFICVILQHNQLPYTLVQHFLTTAAEQQKRSSSGQTPHEALRETSAAIWTSQTVCEIPPGIVGGAAGDESSKLQSRMLFPVPLPVFPCCSSTQTTTHTTQLHVQSTIAGSHDLSGSQSCGRLAQAAGMEPRLLQR